RCLPSAGLRGDLLPFPTRRSSDLQHLLNITIAGVSGLFGMYALHEGLSVVCEQRGVYPRKALTIMRAWAVLFGFVGIQLAWSLRDRKSTRLNSSHVAISYAVFCLK